jgi:hypothetical protein
LKEEYTFFAEAEEEEEEAEYPTLPSSEAGPTTMKEY